jgi:threonine aldolase
MNKEAGAASNYIGCALIPVRSKHGKISADAIEETIVRLQSSGYSINKPRAVSVTQSTEYGTVYTIDELMSISKVCKKYGLLFHMDGVRLSNAAAALNVTLKAITSDVGVDVITFGGTKNGLMFGDAIVIFNKQFADEFYYIQKQGFQLNSKMRFLTVQFIAYLEKNIWLDNARHANAMSSKLAAGLTKIPGIEFPYPVETNQLFPCFSQAIIDATQKEFAYSIWDKKTGMVRLLTSFITSSEDIEKFIELAKR